MINCGARTGPGIPSGTYFELIGFIRSKSNVIEYPGTEAIVDRIVLANRNTKAIELPTDLPKTDAPYDDIWAVRSRAAVRGTFDVKGTAYVYALSKEVLHEIDQWKAPVGVSNAAGTVSFDSIALVGFTKGGAILKRIEKYLLGTGTQQRLTARIECKKTAAGEFTSITSLSGFPTRFAKP